MVFVAVRSFDDIAANGLGGLPQSFSLEAFGRPGSTARSAGRCCNSVDRHRDHRVILVLFLSSLAAFALSRYSIPFRRAILLLMLAGNLLPPQILLIPVSKICEALGIYDTLHRPDRRPGRIRARLLHLRAATASCAACPNEVFEAARIDGAGDMRIFATIVLPLCRPSLAALGALASTWIFNDLIWAMTVLRTQTKFPITAALLNLQGGFVSSWNVVAAGALIAAIPTAIVFFAFQKHFVSGLLVGASK